MASEALGLLECIGLVALMEGTDAMLKSANVEMIGWDKAGSGMVTGIRQRRRGGRQGRRRRRRRGGRPHRIGGRGPCDRPPARRIARRLPQVPKRPLSRRAPVAGRLAETVKK